MLNFDNIPDQQISGLGTDELDWVAYESGTRKLKELSDGFLNYLNDEEDEMDPSEISEEIQKEVDSLPISNELMNILIGEMVENESPELSGEIQRELDDLEIEGTPSSTLKQTKDNVKRLISFLQEKQLSTDLERIPVSLLNDYLRYFYSQLRTKDDKFYASATLICIRAALHRHFLMVRNDVNIIGDSKFTKSNKMLVTMIRKYKKSNQPKRQDVFPVIEKKDMKKIMEYFDRKNGTKLQLEVMFQMIYHFGLRGRETLPYLTRSSFKVCKDSENRKYVILNHELLSKNAKASLKPSESKDAKGARMYENVEDKDCCPVAAFEMYMEIISKNCNHEHLFPKPCTNMSKGLSQKRWYTKKQTVGKNTVDNLMSTLSETLDLSKRYTNHSLRVTHITVLKENGFTNAEIAANTGHKNPESVDKYNRKRRDDDFASMSAALSCETSRNAVVIKRVGKTGKVTIREQEENQGSVHVNVQFSGNFQNCHFYCDSRK